MPFIAIALVIAAALGGGTAAVAEQSLPGDALWGFKTTVNEGIQGALSTSDSARANWDINSIETRLDEAEKLAAKGTLSAEAQAKIDANFDQHSKNVLEIINELQAAGNTKAAADIAAKFQATIADRATLLSETNASAKTEVATQLAPIILKVRGLLDQASNVSAEASAEATTNAEVQADDTSTIQQGDEGMEDSGVKASGKANVNIDTSVGL